MGHLLQIESDEAFAMASELAGLTGESLAGAVTEALRARLDAERKRRQDREAYVARAKELAADLRAHMSHPLGTSDHSDMYDDDGLPV